MATKNTRRHEKRKTEPVRRQGLCDIPGFLPSYVFLCFLWLFSSSASYALPARSVTLVGSDWADGRSAWEVQSVRLYPALGAEPLEERCVPSYSIIDLGTLPDYPNSAASGINASGQVAGTGQRPFGSRGFLWNSGTLTNVGTLGGKDSFGYALNNSGQVVGSAATAAGPFHAFVWRAGVMTDLEPAGGEVNSSARSVNASGQVVGERAPAGGKVPQHAFLYSNGTMTNLNDLVPPGSGWTVTQAAGINDA